MNNEQESYVDEIMDNLARMQIDVDRESGLVKFTGVNGFIELQYGYMNDAIDIISGYAPASIRKVLDDPTPLAVGSCVGGGGPAGSLLAYIMAGARMAHMNVKLEDHGKAFREILMMEVSGDPSWIIKVSDLAMELTIPF